MLFPGEEDDRVSRVFDYPVTGTVTFDHEESLDMKKHQKQTFLPIVALCALATAGPSSIAYADENDGLVVENIPAVACHPEGTGSSLVQVSGGTWQYSPSSTGAVNFSCPIHTNDVEDGANLRFARMRLWYRDGDGTGNGGRVFAILRERENDGDVFSISSTADSNTSSTTTSTTVATDADEFLAPNSLYYVSVTMNRTSASVPMAFTGIDFIPFGGS